MNHLSEITQYYGEDKKVTIKHDEKIYRYTSEN